MLFMGTLLVALSGMLVGCTEEEAAQFNAEMEKLNADGEVIVDGTATEDVESVSVETNSSDLPPNVQNGVVSESVYNELIRLIEEDPTFNQQIASMNKTIEEKPEITKDINFIATNKQLMDKYEVFAKSFYLIPETDADFEIDNLVTQITLSMESYTKHMKEFFKDPSEYYLNKATEEINDRNTSSKALLDVMDKYKLFNDQY
jgi:hypothetical protein